MCETGNFFANSLLRIVKFKISHADANAKNSHLFAKYVKNSHLFSKLYIFVYWVLLNPYIIILYFKIFGRTATAMQTCLLFRQALIISQINTNFMRMFIIRMRMRNFVSMHISQSSKKCYEISHILVIKYIPHAQCFLPDDNDSQIFYSTLCLLLCQPSSTWRTAQGNICTFSLQLR